MQLINPFTGEVTTPQAGDTIAFNLDDDTVWFYRDWGTEQAIPLWVLEEDDSIENGCLFIKYEPGAEAAIELNTGLLLQRHHVPQDTLNRILFRCEKKL